MPGDVESFAFLDVSPRPTSTQHVHQFEDVVYWVKLQVQPASDPRKFVVEVRFSRESRQSPHLHLEFIQKLEQGTVRAQPTLGLQSPLCKPVLAF